MVNKQKDILFTKHFVKIRMADPNHGLDNSR